MIEFYMVCIFVIVGEFYIVGLVLVLREFVLGIDKYKLKD